MKSRLTKEIECLKRLHETTSQLGDILSFLKQELLIDDNQIKTIKQQADHPKEVQAILRDLQVRGKLQMLEYIWEVLPTENIRIHIITDRNQKEFVFNG